MENPKLLRLDVILSIPMKALPPPRIPLKDADDGPQLITDDVCPCLECCQDARPVALATPANQGWLLVAFFSSRVRRPRES
jgi:hypothetical protein